MSTSPTPSELQFFVQQLLRGVAPRILHRFGRTGPLTFKYGREAVTQVDREVEDVLTRRILERFPNHRIHGEERGQAGGDDKAWIWYIDPVDGTLNYALGIPHFSSTVAVSHDGVTVAGGVIDPIRQELYSAARGGGAYLNGERLQVSDRKRLEDAIVSTQISRRSLFVREKDLLQQLHQTVLKTRRLGSIALELAYVAAGRLDVLLAGKSVPQNPYDVDAGLLLVKEAGGGVTDAAGGARQPDDTEMVVSNGHVHDELIDLIRPYLRAN